MKKYLMNGEEVEAVQQLNDGRWLVYHYYYECVQTAPDDCYEEEFLSDRPDIVSGVFDTPPIPKIDDSVKAQQKRLADIQREITETIKAKQELDREFKAAKRLHVKRMEAYKQYGPSMDNLDAVLNGEITHYVVKSSYQNIGHVKEYTKKDFEIRYRGPKKFLILGQTDAGELRWYLTEYDDISGASDSNKFIWPCTSELQARTIVQQQINDVTTPDRPLLDYAKKYGYTVKDADTLEIALNAKERAKALEELKKAQKNVESAHKRMDELSQV